MFLVCGPSGHVVSQIVGASVSALFPKDSQRRDGLSEGGGFEATMKKILRSVQDMSIGRTAGPPPTLL